MKRLLIIIIIAQCAGGVSAQINTARTIKNLESFAKICGYVRYFYPGDEAARLNWEQFIYYGVKQVESLTNNRELSLKLQQLFYPVAPAMIIDYKTKATAYKEQRVNNAGMLPVYWQHYGYGQSTMRPSPYESIRVNRDSLGKDLFDEKPKWSDILIKDITPEIRLFMPLVLMGDSLQTYPAADKLLLRQLQEQAAREWPEHPSGDNKHIRITDMIILWNVMKHFNPHWAFASITPGEMLTKGIAACYTSNSSLSFYNVLRKITAPFNDSHTGFYVDHKDTTVKDYLLPVRFGEAESKIVVDYTNDSLLAAYFKPGDIVEQINGKNIFEYKKEYEAKVSGSPHFKSWYATAYMLYDTTTKVTVQLKGKTAVTFEKKTPLSKFNARQRKQKTTGWLEPGIFYLDIDNATDSAYQHHLPEILRAKVLICDLRTYPKGNYVFNLLQSLLRKPPDKDWLFTPQIIYPDFEKVTFNHALWPIKPDTVHPIRAKVFLLISPRSISYAESVIGHFKHYQLATIIGQPTAGANGNVARVNLPGGYTVGWTEMLVKQQNGEPLFGIGFAPDIPVNRTIKGIRENRDEVMERALSESHNYLNKHPEH